MHQVTQILVTYDFEEINETAFLHCLKLTEMLITEGERFMDSGAHEPQSMQARYRDAR